MTSRKSDSGVPRSPISGGAEPAASSKAPLPNERDEASGSTGGAPSEIVKQGHRDLRKGLEDTDRGPVMDEAYRKQKK
jgi:hypothetical protein